MTENVTISANQAKLYTNLLSNELDKLEPNEQQLLEKLAIDLNNELMKEVKNKPEKAMLVCYIMFSSVLEALRKYGIFNFFPEFN
jgi:hypothetical protein